MTGIITAFLSLAAILCGTEHADSSFTDSGTGHAVLVISGAATAEELSLEETEKFRRYVSNPLDINAASIGKLQSCGLLTQAQANSIIKYRTESGDILSWTELSLLDGFDREYAEALRHFTVLRSSLAPGQKENLRPGHEVMARGSLKVTDWQDTQAAAGLKYSFNLGERAELFWATRTTYDDARIGIGTASAAWYGKRHIGKIVAGDMGLRFGQGLALWSGFTMSGMSTIQSYRRNPTGISPTSSYSSVHKGIGIDFNFRSKGKTAALYTFTAAYSITGKLPVLNITRTGHTSTFGITATSKAASADFRTGLPSVSIFGEACWNFQSNNNIGAVFGTIWAPAYGRKAGAVARYANSTLQPAAGYESTMLKLNFEGKVNYAKRTETYKLTLASGDSLFNFIRLPDGYVLEPAARLTGKMKPQEECPFRTDLRLDVKLKKGGWTSNWRTDLEYSENFSWHTCLECGCDKSRFSIWARAGFFHVDSWEDRIYVYERDLPGYFNCPALYGRGFDAFILGRLKFGRRLNQTATLKISTTEYFIDKPSKFEFKLQYSFNI